MNYNETLRYIHSMGMFGKKATLSRMNEVLKKISEPQKKLRAIHIAGTNGKGSVSAMLSEIFRRAGYNTGLYISPYITDFRERIQINGELIPENELVRLAQTVRDAGTELTEFEFITAIGFLYFSQNNCDIVIAETGLGGRLDATNTLEDVVASVITKIGLDHTAVLGDTIEKIAHEKCGIIKNNLTVTSPFQDENALSVIKNTANRLIIPDVSELSVISSDINGNEFLYKGRRYKTSLAGVHQIENALIAIETASNIGYNITYNILYEALSRTSFPARLEVISRSPLLILDGAHNPDGAAALAGFMKRFNGNTTAIIGMMRDKNYDRVLELTLCHCENAITVTVAGNSRSLTADELSQSARRYCKNVFVAENYDDAIEIALAAADGNPVFVYGSLYLAGGIRNKLIKRL